MTDGTEELRHPDWLVQTDWLEAHLDDPGLRIFDCTMKLDQVAITCPRVSTSAPSKSDGPLTSDMPSIFESRKRNVRDSGNISGSTDATVLSWCTSRWSDLMPTTSTLSPGFTTLVLNTASRTGVSPIAAGS